MSDDETVGDVHLIAEAMGLTHVEVQRDAGGEILLEGRVTTTPELRVSVTLPLPRER